MRWQWTLQWRELARQHTFQREPRNAIWCAALLQLGKRIASLSAVLAVVHLVLLHWLEVSNYHCIENHCLSGPILLESYQVYNPGNQKFRNLSLWESQQKSRISEVESPNSGPGLSRELYRNFRPGVSRN